MKEKIFILLGATSTGKTSIAIELAKLNRGEIISADSMQIYKYMDIGTAKPSKEEMQGIPHHMIDFLDPGEKFSVSEFKEKAEEIIYQIIDRGNLPIIVGGTGLYIKSLTDPVDFSDIPADETYRDKLRKEADKNGSVYLHNRLKEVDWEAGLKIHENDLRRIIRALEVYDLSGIKISEVWKSSKSREPLFNPIMAGLQMNRESLYKNINKRVDDMIDKGLIEEVKRLKEMGYEKELISMQALGYKEFFPYLRGETTLYEATELLKRDTRRYAKRQLTWFREDARIKWYGAENYINRSEVIVDINKYLNQFIEERGENIE